ncbi:MAG: hypothetical protein J6P29_05505 [Acetobacter sp.]|nr:hypothetical protein [Acetobacter sp.]
MKIRCKNCGYKEKVNKDLFLKVIGGAVTGGGFWAWVSYFLAGTGFAFEICTALVLGGVAMLVFSDQITKFFCKKYSCPRCGSKNWEGIV